MWASCTRESGNVAILNQKNVKKRKLNIGSAAFFLCSVLKAARSWTVPLRPTPSPILRVEVAPGRSPVGLEQSTALGGAGCRGTGCPRSRGALARAKEPCSWSPALTDRGTHVPGPVLRCSPRAAFSSTSPPFANPRLVSAASCGSPSREAQSRGRALRTSPLALGVTCGSSCHAAPGQLPCPRPAALGSSPGKPHGVSCSG